jgi:rhodanese-related sulfurtransferase
MTHFTAAKRGQPSRPRSAPGARGVFYRDFPAAFQGLVELDDEVVVICWQGNRSSLIAKMPAEQGGDTKVYNPTEGIRKWLKDGKPVVKQ